MNTKNFLIRYLTIILFGLGNLFLIYKILTPLTLASVNLVLSTFYKTTVIENTLATSAFTIELIPACVAGSAFYLLLILNLSTPIKNPTKPLLFSLGTFFIFNIARIIILTLTIQSRYFDELHLFFWYFLSTIAIIILWILTIKIYKIKSIPFYTDFKELKKQIRKPK